MALRHRTISTQKLADQENVQQVSKTKVAVGSRITKRSALGEIANTVTTAKPKEPLKKTSSLSQIPKVQQQKPKAEVKPGKVVQNAENNAPKALVKHKTTVVNQRGAKTTTSTVNLQPVKVGKLFSPVVIPNSVNNIDENDEGNIFLVPEYVNDIYKYLRFLELKFLVQPKYLTGQVITPKMRAVLIDWLVEVQQQYHLLAETLHLCIAIVDLFLQKVTYFTKDKLQLIGVTAMYVACKYEETYSPDISDFVYITDSTFSKRQILSLERMICRKLNFSFGRPASIHFLRRYSKAAVTTPIHHTFGKYFLDLAMLEYSLVNVRPSLMAAVASFVAHSIFENETGSCSQVWNKTMIFYTSYTYSDLKPYIPLLASAILKAPNSGLKAIPQKFAGADMHNVSSRSELQSDDLKRLAGAL